MESCLKKNVIGLAKISLESWLGFASHYHALCYGFKYSKDNSKNINSHTSSKPSGFQVSRILRILYQRVCLKNQANVLESNQVESKVDSQRIS